ncbi:hypothetical protein [Pseudomonas paracarnis]|uniref:hypothetical protein n=1 Tax=Pseudomonas paracarnis TaxID=2750625 RepID=UPI001F432E6C|nr:hypothetical protein [Pseudomonas paracarnis]
MTDYTELKRLAEACVAAGEYLPGEAWEEARSYGPDEVAFLEFAPVATPAAVLVLLDDIATLKAGGQLLVQDRNDAWTERDQLRAEVAGLKTGYEAYERVNAELKAENEALRREREGKVLCDLELFETLRDAANTEADEHRQCMATYRPLRQENLDSVVKKCDDLLAAMGKGEQS